MSLRYVLAAFLGAVGVTGSAAVPGLPHNGHAVALCMASSERSDGLGCGSGCARVWEEVLMKGRL